MPALDLAQNRAHVGHVRTGGSQHEDLALDDALQVKITERASRDSRERVEDAALGQEVNGLGDQRGNGHEAAVA